MQDPSINAGLRVNCNPYTQISSFQNLVYRQPLLRVSRQHTFKQIDDLRREITWVNQILGQNFGVKFVSVWIFEGQMATEHGKQHDATWPNIWFFAVITQVSLLISANQHFRCSITWTSAGCAQIISLVAYCIAQPEVDYFQLSTASKKQIFRLDISMNDLKLVMHVLHTWNKFGEQANGLVLGKSSISDNQVK